MLYRPKEILIMEALIHKVCEGKEVSQLRVQEIAIAAGVGKGTIYEYFSSKDEIVERSIFYSMDKELQMLEQVIDEAEDFDSLLWQIVQALCDILKNRRTVYTILLQNRGRELETCIRGEHKEEFRRRYKLFLELQDQIVQRGKQECWIDAALSDEFCRYVIYTALMSIAGEGFLELQGGIDENAMQLIRRCIGADHYSNDAKASERRKV